MHLNRYLRQNISRRGIVGFLASLPIGLFSSRPAAALKTPLVTAGPFYPTPAMRFADADNDLVKIEGEVREAGGEVIVLKGQVFDPAGKPAKGARVEIWQCDAYGIYLHTHERRLDARDTAFQGFGHVVTGSDGAYAFRTIKPVPYPRRSPHIHIKVFYDNQELTSQFYIDGHPENAGDVLFRRLSPPEQRDVSMVFINGRDGLEAPVDVYL